MISSLFEIQHISVDQYGHFIRCHGKLFRYFLRWLNERCVGFKPNRKVIECYSLKNNNVTHKKVFTVKQMEKKKAAPEHVFISQMTVHDAAEGSDRRARIVQKKRKL